MHCKHTATHCNTLQHTATHCNTLQTLGNETLVRDTTYSYVLPLQCTANTLQHIATHCNTLQHTATHCKHTATHGNETLLRMHDKSVSSPCVAVCLQCVAVCCSVFAVCCSVLQCVAVCCSVLQCVCMTRFLYTCDMTHSYVRSFPHMRHNSSICGRTYSYVT